MTSLNPSIRVALINKAKHQKNRLSKGFTLVELMVTVAIVGLLSGVALPQFLNYRQTASRQSAFIEAIGLAQECATARKVDQAALYPDPYAEGLIDAGIASGNCSDDTGTITYTSRLGGGLGQVCGNVVLAADDSLCRIAVAPGGGQTFTEVPAAE